MRPDANSGAVADHLRANGWGVHVTTFVGEDFPDLVCACRLFTALVEVKDGSKPPSKRKLSEGQQRFRDAWPGVVITALTPEHALLQLEAWLAKLMGQTAPES